MDPRARRVQIELAHRNSHPVCTLWRPTVKTGAHIAVRKGADADACRRMQTCASSPSMHTSKTCRGTPSRLTKSPRPRMRSPSVMTVTLTSASGQLSITWCQGGRLLASESAVCRDSAVCLSHPPCLPAALSHNALPHHCASATKKREAGVRSTDLPHFAAVMD